MSRTFITSAMEDPGSRPGMISITPRMATGKRVGSVNAFSRAYSVVACVSLLSVCVNAFFMPALCIGGMCSRWDGRGVDVLQGKELLLSSVTRCRRRLRELEWGRRMLGCPVCGANGASCCLFVGRSEAVEVTLLAPSVWGTSWCTSGPRWATCGCISHIQSDERLSLLCCVDPQ